MSAYLRSASSALEVLRPMPGHSAPPATSTTHQLVAQPRKVPLSFRTSNYEEHRSFDIHWFLRYDALAYLHKFMSFAPQILFPGIVVAVHDNASLYDSSRSYINLSRRHYLDQIRKAGARRRRAARVRKRGPTVHHYVILRRNINLSRRHYLRRIKY